MKVIFHFQKNFNKSINIYVHRNSNELFYKKFYYDFYNNIISSFIVYVYKLYDSNKYTLHLINLISCL